MPTLLKKSSLIVTLLVLAIFLGTLVRVWKITTLPYPPNGDELFFGYYGWSLLNFQTDEFGNFLPLSFASIGDFKYPVLAYLNIIPAALFGLNEITVRFWSVISGIALIPLIYFLSLQLFKNQIAALASAWMVAFSPWSITMSRLGLENHLAFVLTLAALMLILYLSNTTRKQVFISCSIFILLLMAIFSYGAQKIFVPSLLLFLIIILPKIRKILLILFILLSVISILSFFSWQTRGRADSVIFNPLQNSHLNNQILQRNIESGLSPIQLPLVIKRTFNNKLFLGLNQYLKNYINHFSPSFLFFEGENSIERIPYTGQLLLIDLILLPAGLIALRKQSRQAFLIIIGWLILSPIPSATTIDAPHINRASMMVPALALLSGLGFRKIVTLFKGKLAIVITCMILVAGLFSTLITLNLIFIHKPVFQPWYSETINKQLIKDLSELKDKYQTIAISRDEFIFFF